MTAVLSAIALTFVLTSSLAWVAWRQRPVPAARAFAWMLTLQCLLALSETLSMLGPDAAWARFWFDLRFLFIAAIPVALLLFALAYAGRRDSVSRPFFATLLLVPLLTQVLLWTNGLHGWWVQHEVGFRQEGLFWVADTSQRVPGLWFLVHNFYTILLLLVSIIILLAAAWRRSRSSLRQSILVSLGALISLVAGLIPVFNLAPQLGFNPFVPCIGLSAVLYAVAILRLHLLKRVPTSGGAADSASGELREARSSMYSVLAGVLVVAVCLAVAFITYADFRRNYTTRVMDELTAVASLKVFQLANWRNERLADAESLMDNAAFSTLVDAFEAARPNPALGPELASWMDSLRLAYQYSCVYLFDPHGQGLLASPRSAAYPEHLAGEIPRAVLANQVIELDFHRHPDGHIYYSVLAPILSPQGGLALGVVVLESDPDVYLYPYLAIWPLPSETAETLIVRRDGDDVLYISPLRFDPQAALSRRAPLTQTQLPAVQAGLGETGVIRGVDYRGERVVAAITAVPNSPWFVVARIDQAEVYAALRERLWQTGAFVGAMGAVSLLGIGMLRREQRLRHLRVRYQAAERLRESEEKFRTAFLISPDAVSLSRLDGGEYVAVNQGFERLLGYTQGEALGKSSLDLELWVDPIERNNMITTLQANGTVSDFETQFRTKHGDVRQGLLSAALIGLGGDQLILKSIRDITERKQAEKNARDLLAQTERGRRALASALEDQKRAREQTAVSEARFRALFEGAAEGILVTDAETHAFLHANPAICRMLGYTAAELRSLGLANIHPRDAESPLLATFAVMKDGDSKAGVSVPCVRKDGSIIYVDISGVRQVLDGRPCVVGFFTDATDRLRREEEQHRIEAQLRQTQKLEAIGTLASGVAHEINNPLMGMLNYAELVKERVAAIPRVVELADGILEEGWRIANIVKNLLSFARRDEATGSLASVREIVDASLSLLGNLLIKSQIELHIDIPSDLPAVRCRRQQIQQVLVNLIRNAQAALDERYLHAAPDKTLSITAGVLDDQEGTWVRIAVEDHGTGVPESIRERIFEPFFTNKGRDRGSGLGLWVSRGIVAEHHGRLLFETQVGEYTRFYVDLPLPIEPE